jgi:hypothetical protein
MLAFFGAILGRLVNILVNIFLPPLSVDPGAIAARLTLREQPQLVWNLTMARDPKSKRTRVGFLDYLVI